ACVVSVCWCSSCCASPTSSVSRRAKRFSMASKRPAISSRVVFAMLFPSRRIALGLAPGAEARPPGLTYFGEQFLGHHLLAMGARVDFHGLDHHAPREGWNGLEALTRRVFPAQLLGDLKAECL